MPAHGTIAAMNLRRIRRWLGVSSAAGLAWLLVWPFAVRKPPCIPLGAHVRSRPFALDTEGVRLLLDATAACMAGETREIRQENFEAVLELIERADAFLFLDFFLWNGWQGHLREDHRALSSELADRLVAKRREAPDLPILILTDPINRVYGRGEEAFYHRLAENGIPVVFTDLERLRESNPLYAYPAAVYGRWLRNIPCLNRLSGRPLVPNPFQPGNGRISPSQAARLLRFKANHRKVLVAGFASGEHRVLVTSFNPADGSSAHSNAGLIVRGNIATEVLLHELQVVQWSARNGQHVLERSPGDWQTAARRLLHFASREVPRAEDEPRAGTPTAVWLTEGAIFTQLLAMLNGATEGDEVRVAMFYLSDHEVVRAILAAARRGARVRLILDANRDAFGRRKNGVPNRPVAARLMRLARRDDLPLSVRWANTGGEQFHTKVVSLTPAAPGACAFLCGSANLTRRNLRDFNLEGNLYLDNVRHINERFDAYFDRAWDNLDGLRHTLPYAAFGETGWRLLWKTIQYEIQERTGLSTF